ncbi:MAG TPA: hypothetical protein VJL89_04690, partial [Thermodesulfovibrionia bacterium]|nr:hypothetical protein [Thermodesulfovibrionia bacterium]
MYTLKNNIPDYYPDICSVSGCNDAGIRISELQQLYAKNVLSTYSLQGGYFIIDDTMEHHT